MKRTPGVGICRFEPCQEAFDTKMRRSPGHDFFVFPEEAGFAGFSDFSVDAAGVSLAPLLLDSLPLAASVFVSFADSAASG
jgi:hypothetical protein